jgi:hypothetical protein
MKKLKLDDLKGVKEILSREKMKKVVGGYGGGGNCIGFYGTCGGEGQSLPCCSGLVCLPSNGESECI